VNGVLLLRLAGPMQSWGTCSRFVERETLLEPSKSGVIGLICAAMGISRDDDAALHTLATLEMGVRVDREGRLARDFQTAGGGRWPGLKKYGVIKADGSAPDTVISNRYYLADAEFTVALGGDSVLLEKISLALDNPVWPLSLGRKSYVPGKPIRPKDGSLNLEILNCTVEEALRTQPYLYRENRTDKKTGQIRMILENLSGEGTRVMDQPLSFKSNNRRYGARYVKIFWINIQNEKGGGGDDSIAIDT
jgi:CRISPR system Cascade subunit CasD